MWSLMLRARTLQSPSSRWLTASPTMTNCRSKRGTEHFQPPHTVPAAELADGVEIVKQQGVHGER